MRRVWNKTGGRSVNQTWLATGFFFALFILILYGAFLILTPFLTAITWAVILAILVYPVYAWLLQRFRGRATLAAITVIAAITLIVIVPGIEFGRFLVDEAVLLVQSLGSLLDENGKEEWLAKPWVQQLVGWWDMVSFRLIEFNINWKELLAQGAQSSSKVAGRAGQGHRPECVVLCGKFCHRSGHFVFPVARRQRVYFPVAAIAADGSGAPAAAV